MKVDEFIKTLEEGELFPFSNVEKATAVRLAKRYRGKTVLDNWQLWRATNTGGFVLFSQLLPQMLDAQKEARQHAPEGHQSGFASSLPGGSLVQMMMDKVNQNRKDMDNTKIVEVYESQFSGHIDPIEGWMIGNIPVF